MENVVIDFYKYTGAPNAVDKSASLGSVAMTMDGVFKTPFDVLNPSVIVQPTNVSVRNFLKNQYNYVCVKTFNENDRYYFVDGMRALNDKLVEVDLREDVLMQYKEDIYTLQCFVNRCSSSSYHNRFIQDSARSFGEMKVQNVTLTYYHGDNTYINVSFVSGGFYVVVAEKGRTDSPQDDQLYNSMPAFTNAYPSVTGLPAVDRQQYAIGGSASSGSRDFHSFSTYYLALSKGQFLLLQNMMLSPWTEFENLKNSIRGVMAFPFNIPSSDILVQTYIPYVIGGQPLKFNDETGTVMGYGSVINPTSGYLVLEDFAVPFPEGFEGLPPYSSYEIFIPFCGWVDFPTTSMNHRMIVYYVVDYVSGQAQASLFDVIDENVVWSSVCQLGVSISLTTDNQAELNRQKTSNALNTILQIAGSTASIVAGIASENPVAVAGGAISMARAVGGGAVNAMNMIERASVGYADPNLALYQMRNVKVRRRYAQPINDYGSVNSLIGTPTSKVLRLSVLRGTGFANITDVYSHLNSGIMQTEWEEIVRLLKEGVYL